MSTPKKIKLTKKTTLNSFFSTRQDVNTDDTLQAMNTDDQDSLLAKDCDSETTSLSEKPRGEIITAAASTSTSSLSSTEEDPISLEKGREEISTAFNDVLSQELKLHNYFLCHGKCSSVNSSSKIRSITLGWLNEVFVTMQGQVSGGFATRRNQVCTVYYVTSMILSTPETNLKFGTISPP